MASRIEILPKYINQQHQTENSFTTDITTNEGSVFCQVSPSICPAEVHIDTAVILKTIPIAFLPSSLERGNSTELTMKSLQSAHRHFPMSQIFNQHSMGKPIHHYRDPALFRYRQRLPRHGQRGLSLCEVSPSICPTEACFDTAALENNALLVESKTPLHTETQPKVHPEKSLFNGCATTNETTTHSKTALIFTKHQTPRHSCDSGERKLLRSKQNINDDDTEYVLLDILVWFDVCTHSIVSISARDRERFQVRCTFRLLLILG